MKRCTTECIIHNACHSPNVENTTISMCSTGAITLEQRFNIRGVPCPGLMRCPRPRFFNRCDYLRTAIENKICVVYFRCSVKISLIINLFVPKQLAKQFAFSSAFKSHANQSLSYQNIGHALFYIHKICYVSLQCFKYAWIPSSPIACCARIRNARPNKIALHS